MPRPAMFVPQGRAVPDECVSPTGAKAIYILDFDGSTLDAFAKELEQKHKGLKVSPLPTPPRQISRPGETRSALYSHLGTDTVNRSPPSPAMPRIQP